MTGPRTAGVGESGEGKSKCPSCNDSGVIEITVGQHSGLPERDWTECDCGAASRPPEEEQPAEAWQGIVAREALAAAEGEEA